MTKKCSESLLQFSPFYRPILLCVFPAPQLWAVLKLKPATSINTLGKLSTTALPCQSIFIYLETLKKIFKCTDLGKL